VLVGITTRNRKAVLPRAIASALDQSGVALEVAVHDDGSSDGTAQFAGNYHHVTWTRGDTSIGLRAVRNQWMLRDDIDFFVSLDDDAWFRHGDEVALALERFQQDPSLGAVAFDILAPDAPDPRPRTGARPASMFIGCGHMLRTAAAREIGGYADLPGPYGAEEKEFCLRLADAGYRVELLAGVHVWHSQAWAGRDPAPLHRSGVLNELVMTVRRCPCPDLFLVLPWKVVSLLTFWARNPTLARPGFAALRDTIRHLPGAWRQRAPVRRSTFWRFHRRRFAAP
jgi:glycosyltransferase involved in cell wall biosynthesis